MAVEVYFATRGVAIVVAQLHIYAIAAGATEVGRAHCLRAISAQTGDEQIGSLAEVGSSTHYRSSPLEQGVYGRGGKWKIIGFCYPKNNELIIRDHQ